MAEPTRAFFTKLAGGHQPRLEGVTGVIRFDIADGERTEHWYLHIRKGDVTISHEESEADCVISADIETFDAILAGRMNAAAAVLRGTVDVAGKVMLVTALQRLFPGSAPSDEQPAAGYARRRS